MTASSFYVRLANVKDADMIVQFNYKMAQETESLVLEQETLRRGVQRVFEENGKFGFYVVACCTNSDIVIGCLMITFEWSDWRAKMIWWIQSVFVEPAFRKRGVFRALLGYVLKEAGDQGNNVASLRLYAEGDNEIAKTVYQKLGFHLSHYDLLEKNVSSSF